MKHSPANTWWRSKSSKLFFEFRRLQFLKYINFRKLIRRSSRTIGWQWKSQKKTPVMSKNRKKIKNSDYYIIYFVKLEKLNLKNSRRSFMLKVNSHISSNLLWRKKSSGWPEIKVSNKSREDRITNCALSKYQAIISIDNNR